MIKNNKKIISSILYIVIMAVHFAVLIFIVPEEVRNEKTGLALFSLLSLLSYYSSKYIHKILLNKFNLT